MKRIIAMRYLLICCLTFTVEDSKGDRDDLYNTKVATSDLLWTAYPSTEGWEEVSGLDLDDKTIRYYQVCRLQEQETSNWVRTPFISSRGAKRAYIDVEFSMMKCENLQSSCRETFNLYYYESESDEASSTFPPWQENPYIKIDTIAAGERFSATNLDRNGGVNQKTWTLGPLSRSGFYIAAHDKGACMSLLSLRVYFYYCPATQNKLAVFPRTVAGGHMTSLVEVDGECVPDANSVDSANHEAPRFYCTSNGQWKIRTTACHCQAGYEANRRLTECKVCGTGRYKSLHGNEECQMCPPHSMSAVGRKSPVGAEEEMRSFHLCECDPGYYRAATDSIHAPCTRPPSKPSSAMSEVHGTSLLVRWSPPEDDGERMDLYYNVSCRKCTVQNKALHYTAEEQCSLCGNKLLYNTSNPEHVTGTSLMISNLLPFTVYRFQISAMNGVSKVSETDPEQSTIVVVTEETEPSPVVNPRLTSIGEQNLTVAWGIPDPTNGIITLYEVESMDLGPIKPSVKKQGNVSTTTRTVNLSATLTNLQPAHLYSVRIRAATSAGFGPYSHTISGETEEEDHDVDPRRTSIAEIMIGVAIGATLLTLFLLALLYLRCKKKLARSQITNVSTSEEKIPFNASPHTDTLIVRLPSLSSNNRVYVEYPDPSLAVRQLSCEITLSRLLIEEVVGQGEFGEVCRGLLREGNSKIDVAVKRLKPGATTKDQVNFLTEASTMAQFSHPNVVHLKGVITKSCPQMIVTEFMEKGSLDLYLTEQRSKLSILQLMQMLKGIASGMRYLSSMKYVHRDLAARNILVNSDLVCKVSDFGLSRTLENDPHATYTTQGGKIAIRWTAPECIRYRQFTSASDVWSYGIVMWEVFSYGEKPYWDMSNDDITEVIEDGYRLPAPMGCPYILHSLMLQCWMYEPRRRPSFIEILAQLDKFINQPSLLDDETLPDQSAPLLNPDSPTSLQEVNTLDEWLDMVKLGRYRRSFYDHGIKDLESLAHITPSDLERLGIASANHLTRLQGGLDTLRRHLGSASPTSGVQQGTRNANTLRSPVRDSSNLVQSPQTFTLPHRQASKGGSTQRDALPVAVV